MPSSAWSSDVCSSDRSEEHTSELQSLTNLVCRLLLEKKKNTSNMQTLNNLKHYVLLKSNDERLHFDYATVSRIHSSRSHSGVDTGVGRRSHDVQVHDM